jgi:hypothetical protein
MASRALSALVLQVASIELFTVADSHLPNLGIVLDADSIQTTCTPRACEIDGES